MRHSRSSKRTWKYYGVEIIICSVIGIFVGILFTNVMHTTRYVPADNTWPTEWGTPPTASPTFNMELDVAKHDPLKSFLYK